MNIMQNFAFDEQLVRVIERAGEPWFVLNDVCRVLDITNSGNAAARLDDDEKGIHTMDTLGGAQEVTIINESGLYSLVLTSRKPEAKRFKKWITAEVLPSIRKTGAYGSPRMAPPEPFEIDVQHAPLSAKVELLRFISRVRGREAAVRAMPALGLPDLDLTLANAKVSPGGAECLEYVLNGSDEDGTTIRELIRLGIEAHKPLFQSLPSFGLRLQFDPEPGLIVATHPNCVERLFSGSPWEHGKHLAALRGLAGVSKTVSKSYKFAGFVSTAVFVPSEYLA